MIWQYLFSKKILFNFLFLLYTEDSYFMVQIKKLENV